MFSFCYIKQKFKAISACDKTISLLLDEMHLKPYFDFKEGNTAGQAHSSIEPAELTFVFMITSLFSSYKDVVYIIYKIAKHPTKPKSMKPWSLKEETLC